MLEWRESLGSTLLELLGDLSSPQKRSVTLWTLGQLIGATGFVVEPYIKYPTLLDTLLNFLKVEQEQYIRYHCIYFI